MSSKKLQVGQPLLYTALIAFGMLVGYKLREDTGSKSFFGSMHSSSMQEVEDLIRAKYVDKVNLDSLNEASIQEMLSHLDPHSVYIPPTEVRTVNDDLKGNFQGIGIEFQVFDDTLNVVNVIKDGPSEKAGIQVGDKFLKVDDSIRLTVKQLPYDKIRGYLRGEDGSTVKITVLRQGAEKTLTVKRGIISVSTVDAAYMLTPVVGYIKINKFGDKTYEEFMQNLEKLQKKGLQKLILDLRGNGGGFMGEATDIADEFLDGEKLIVYTQGSQSEKVTYKCKRDGLFEKGALAVLVDETSASASEVLTGALQDWDRATIIGRRTFGKGLVQQQFNLSNGGALRLTTARYYTPLGRNIQKSYANKSKKEYQEEVLERYKDGEVVNGGDTTPKNRPAFKTPKGKIVYGGGGILPDIFVAADTGMISKELVQLNQKAILNRFVLQFYLSNKAYFQQIKDVSAFISGFQFSEKDWQNFCLMATKEQSDVSKSLEKDKQVIVLRLKYLLAKQAFNNEGYYETMNKTDKSVLKALEVME